VAGIEEWMDERGDETGHSEEMGLTELVEAAGVSVRTIRYYIAEGLLPPPLSAGPRAAYTPEHLDRLRLIARLKDAYLPLREIRRRLRGLDAGAVRALLNEVSEDSTETPEQPEPPSQRAAHLDEDSAAAYLSRLLHPRHGKQQVSAPAPPASSAEFCQMTPFALDRSRSVPVGEPAASPEYESERSESASLIRADLERGAALAALDALADPDASPVESWRRLRLGDDAELLIRADAYDRQRDQIDSLVAWARRILD